MLILLITQAGSRNYKGMDPKLQPRPSSCNTREVVTDTQSTTSRKSYFRSAYFLGDYIDSAKPERFIPFNDHAEHKR